MEKQAKNLFYAEVKEITHPEPFLEWVVPVRNLITATPPESNISRKSRIKVKNWIKMGDP